jgi:two-component system KDP operon response regulator KdpE
MSAPLVLVLDDMETMLMFARIVLEREGYRVQTVRNLAGLDAALAHEQPDLILLDVNLEEVMGYELVGFLRDRRGVTGRIVLVSGIKESVLAEHAARVGADGYIVKQRGPSYLADGVRAQLEAHRKHGTPLDGVTS